jgi:glucosylceramidase
MAFWMEWLFIVSDFYLCSPWLVVVSVSQQLTTCGLDHNQTPVLNSDIYIPFYLGYGGIDRLTDGTYGYENVRQSHNLIPEKILLATEGCSCPGIEFNGWLRAERVAHDILFDLQNFAQGWLDWNLLVDDKGGPNHLGNNCDASLLAVDGHQDIHIQPKFFYFAHFFRFIIPGSVRVESQAIGQYEFQAMDANIQSGIELSIFACEGSSRQIWTIHAHTGKLQVASSTATDMPLCVSRGDGNRPFLRLSLCVASNDSTVDNDLRVTLTAKGQLVDSITGKCVLISTERASLTEALLILADCWIADHNDAFSLTVNGEIVVMNTEQSDAIHYCLTAGWPFFNSISFKTPFNQTVTVLTNEASVPMKYVLHDRQHQQDLAMVIDARAIQTIIYQ